MFTLSEMDNYNCRKINENINSQFSRSVKDLGWNVSSLDSYTTADKKWISSFENMPGWLADSYNDSIFQFNYESYPLWDEWIDREPELFNVSGLRRDILRVCSDENHFKLSKLRQDNINATLRLPSLDEIIYDQPILKDAIESKEIVGGVYVHGFTINVHNFMRNLISQFEALGVEFDWNTSMIELVDQNSKGKLNCIKLSTGELIGGNIVIPPGAYAGRTIKKSNSYDQICGVLGAWLTLPDSEALLRNSLKLARKNHITEDSNVTVSWSDTGEQTAIIGSGYGFTGISPDNINQELLSHIYGGLIDTAKKCFPRQYQQLADNNSLNDTLKYCVRPWTSSGLGVFEMFKSDQSCIIIVCGHNTGGFAQAPAIAKAVLSAVNNHHHRMHFDYHINRPSLIA